jgi:heme A synthase
MRERPPHLPFATRVVVVIGALIVGGGVLGAAACASSILMNRRGGLPLHVGLLGGALLGAASAAWLLSLLVNTRLRRSLLLVFGSSLPVVVGAGAIDPLLASVGGALVQLLAAVFAYVAWPCARYVRMGLCARCGYKLGADIEVCPECGTTYPPAAAKREPAPDIAPPSSAPSPHPRA